MAKEKEYNTCYGNECAWCKYCERKVYDLRKYNKQHKKMVAEFLSRYYYDMDYNSIPEYDVVWDYKIFPAVICVGEETRYIDNIREAIHYDIEKKVLMEWYDYKQEHYMSKKKWHPTNLWSWNMWWRPSDK